MAVALLCLSSAFLAMAHPMHNDDLLVARQFPNQYPWLQFDVTGGAASISLSVPLDVGFEPSITWAISTICVHDAIPGTECSFWNEATGFMRVESYGGSSNQCIDFGPPQVLNLVICAAPGHTCAEWGCWKDT